MDVGLKVTDQPQESSFFDLVSGDSVLAIPLFQRPYRWGQRNLDWLVDDIADVRGGITKSCFLGVVVCVSRGASPGRPIPWEVVDGQQRLSTLYLLLLAAAEVGARAGDLTWAAGVIGTYLLVRPLADNPVNTKLVPSFGDRAQFKRIWDDLASIAGLVAEPSIAANPPRPPASSGLESGVLLSQYNRMRRLLSRIRERDGAEGLRQMVDVAANNLSVVSISLRDPLVAPKIFERLNNRAELVTVADLVRNEVFSKASADAALAQHVFTNQWEPFSVRFGAIDKGLEKFLFPYGLIIDRGLTKAELFSKIRAHWSRFGTPAEIIADMARYAGTFIALETGQMDLEVAPEIAIRLNRIHRLGKPSSTYAFLFRLTEAVRDGSLSVAVARDVFDAIESFLFRRAVAGIEPTGLHAVFKGLWGELTEEEGAPGVSASSVMAAIRSKATVDCPTDEQFAFAIRTGDLYRRKCVTFALREYETAQEGESPSDEFQIEHIAPQTATDEWLGLFGERYEELVNTWGNLIPLTGRMNAVAGQAPYGEKRIEYEGSIFASAREVATAYPTWSPVEVEQRAAAIVSWALERWKEW